MEAPPPVREFRHPPSPSLFSSEVEEKNIPAVIYGCVKDWAAITKWDPSKGGLDYLEGLVGPCTLEAMVSESGPVFYGDLKSHERVPMSFSSFVICCKQAHTDITSCSNEAGDIRLPACISGPFSSSTGAPLHVYVAQVSILNAEAGETSPLKNLLVDFEKPAVLECKSLSSINFWMNNTQSQSSTHYDPHHNLLCVISGCKKVTLWPPSAIPFLYPMPLYGESSNHSAVDVESPDLSIHPRAKDLMDYSQKVILNAGDALFIPEGWFHQVDSTDLTIAVNFWWKSSMMVSMMEHMDAYYLRRILRRLLDKEAKQLLAKGDIKINSEMEKAESHTHLDDFEGPYEAKGAEMLNSHIPDAGVVLVTGQNCESSIKNEGTKLQQLGPQESRCLHLLLSIVHETVNTSEKDRSSSSHNHMMKAPKHISEEQKSLVPTDLHFQCMEADPVASTLSSIEPKMLKEVLMAMVKHFPRSLEALILHMLTPAAAEIVTQKFDEMDRQSTKEEQTKFYELFYSVFSDQFAAMDSILNGKEMFGFQVLRRVLFQQLGVICDYASEELKRFHK